MLLGGLNLFAAPPLGHIRLRADQPVRPALGIPHGQPARQHPAIGAILVAQPMLQLIKSRVALQMGLDGGHRSLCVVRVLAAFPLINTIGQLLLRVAQHLFPAGRVVDRVRPQVPVPDGVVGSLDGQIETLLALL